MSDIEEALTYLIKADDGLTALIGDRVYHRRIKQGSAFPCLTFQRISTPRYQTHGDKGSAGTASPRFQFDAWATTYAGAQAVTNALRALLNGMTQYAMGVEIQSALVEDEREIEDIDQDAGLEGSSSDYIIWHKEN